MAFSYTVKPGDSLVSIVTENYSVDPYGPNGGIEQLLKINKRRIADPQQLVPGTVIRLNKDLLKPGLTDDVPETEDDRIESELTTLPVTKKSKTNAAVAPTEKTTADNDPYIEIEKYDTAQNQNLARYNNEISLFTEFKFNNMDVKHRTLFTTFNLNTSSDTEIGAQYMRAISTETLNLVVRAAVNQFSMSDVAAVTPAIRESSKTQPVGSIGLQYLFAEDNYIQASLRYSPHYYLLTDGSGVLYLDSIASASTSVETENQLYNSKDLILGSHFGLDYISNAQLTGSSSFAFNAGLIYQQNFKAKDKVKIKLLYSQSNLDSEFYTIVNRTISLNLSYALPY